MYYGSNGFIVVRYVVRLLGLLCNLTAGVTKSIQRRLMQQTGRWLVSLCSGVLDLVNTTVVRAPFFLSS